MTTQLKTQLSLILLAGIGTVGLLGFFVDSVRNGFALGGNNSDNSESVVSISADPLASGSEQESGAVLGVSEGQQANPLEGIYVNPFSYSYKTGSGSEQSSSNQPARKQSVQGEAVVLSSLQPKPTAPIQSYIRGYVYPIAELEWCASGQECFEYCEQLSNVPLCAMFAERQGYMKAEMVPVAHRMAVALLSTGNFAECNTAGSCVRLCEQESHAASCAELVNSYQLNTRVLGASTGASYSDDSWPTNPYSNLNQDYSNPALNNFLSATAGTGCAPLDMTCLKNAQNPANPRVLNLSIDDLPGGDGGGGGGTIDPPEPPDLGSTFSTCANNASAGITPNPNSTEANPLPLIIPDTTATYIEDCVSHYSDIAQDEATANAESSRRNTIGGLAGFQNCMSRSANPVADVQRCIAQELQ